MPLASDRDRGGASRGLRWTKPPPLPRCPGDEAAFPQDARARQRLRDLRRARGAARDGRRARLGRSPTVGPGSAATSSSCSSRAESPTSGCGSGTATAARSKPAATRRAASPCCWAARPGSRRPEGSSRASANGAAATVDMGEPRFGWDEIPLGLPDGHGGDAGRLGGTARALRGQCRQPARRLLRRGRPSRRPRGLGPAIERDPLFPERVNVNIASIEEGTIRLRVWERGAGLTQACGTGACATAVAAISRRLASSPVQVRLPGGTLAIDWAPGRHDPDERPGDPGLRRRGRAVSGPQLITLGCRLNAAESEAMRSLAGAEDDLIIVNSCAVTNEAVRQTRQAIRRAKRARPEARVVVTGCAAQIEPETFAAMPEVARVVGNAEKFDPASRSLSQAEESAVAGTSPTSSPSARPRRISSPASPSAAGPSSRCRTAATIAAPSASSPTAAGTAARCRRGWSSNG